MSLAALLIAENSLLFSLRCALKVRKTTPTARWAILGFIAALRQCREAIAEEQEHTETTTTQTTANP